MKFLPLLAVMFLAGCAPSTDQLHTDAMGCGTELVIEPNGIVRTPTEQEKTDQCKPFWDTYNERLIVIAKREREREMERANACPRGSTKVCRGRSRNDKRCFCVSNDEVRRVLLGRF